MCCVVQNQGYWYLPSATALRCTTSTQWRSRRKFAASVVPPRDQTEVEQETVECVVMNPSAWLKRVVWLRHQMRHEPPFPSKDRNFLYNFFSTFQVTGQIPKSISPIPQPYSANGILSVPSRQFVSPSLHAQRLKLQMTAQYIILQQILPSNHCSGTSLSITRGTGTALVDLNKQATSTLVPGHSSGL